MIRISQYMSFINRDLMELDTFLYTQERRADVVSRVAFAEPMSAFIKCFYYSCGFPFYLHVCCLVCIYMYTFNYYMQA